MSRLRAAIDRARDAHTQWLIRGLDNFAYRMEQAKKPVEDRDCWCGYDDGIRDARDAREGEQHET